MKWLALALLFTTAVSIGDAGMLFALRQADATSVASTTEQAEFRYTVQFSSQYSIYDVYCDHGVRMYVSTYDRTFMVYGGDCK